MYGRSIRAPGMAWRDVTAIDIHVSTSQLTQRISMYSIWTMVLFIIVGSRQILTTILLEVC